MYGPRWAVSRSGGVLNAYIASGLSGSILARPISVVVVPMSWNLLSVNSQPLWHCEHIAVISPLSSALLFD